MPAAPRPGPWLTCGSALVALGLSIAGLGPSPPALAADGDPSAARRWFGGPEQPTDLGPTAQSAKMSAAA